MLSFPICAAPYTCTNQYCLLDMSCSCKLFNPTSQKFSFLHSRFFQNTSAADTVGDFIYLLRLFADLLNEPVTLNGLTLWLMSHDFPVLKILIQNEKNNWLLEPVDCWFQVFDFTLLYLWDYGCWSSLEHESPQSCTGGSYMTAKMSPCYFVLLFM